MIFPWFGFVTHSSVCLPRVSLITVHIFLLRFKGFEAFAAKKSTYAQLSAVGYCGVRSDISQKVVANRACARGSIRQTEEFLEICDGKKWIPICLTSWWSHRTLVACAELGFSRKGTSRIYEVLDKKICWNSPFDCNGDERQLSDCTTDEGTVLAFSKSRIQLFCGKF